MSDQQLTTAQGSVHSLAAPEFLSFGKFRDAYNTTIDTRWRNVVLTKMTRLMNLQTGWDGYDGKPIRREVGMFALEILEQVMQAGTPAPDIVPTSDGGVQIEWHVRDIDLEFYVAAPYQCDFWFEDSRNIANSVSKELRDNFSDLQAAVHLLTSR